MKFPNYHKGHIIHLKKQIFWEKNSYPGIKDIIYVWMYRRMKTPNEWWWRPASSAGNTSILFFWTCFHVDVEFKDLNVLHIHLWAFFAPRILFLRSKYHQSSIIDQCCDFTYYRLLDVYNQTPQFRSLDAQTQ